MIILKYNNNDFYVLTSRSLISFLEDNRNFFTNIDICNITQGLDSFIELFYNFTDLIFKDVDFEESYCQYHKDFY